MGLTVVLISILLQFAAAFWAFRLIRLTGRLRAWIFISVALSLMGIRRFISLVHMTLQGQSPDILFEIVGLCLSMLMLAGVIMIAPIFLELKSSEETQRRLVNELREALANIKKLSGLLPICASCKKIRDDKGYWNQIETYIQSHSEAEFSHGICPECAKRLYPEYYKSALENEKNSQ